MIEAFIPKSLGKPLREYFRHNPLYQPDKLVNYPEFEQFLRQADSLPGSWLPEPAPVSVLNSYYLTNDGEVNGRHRDYKIRLAGDLDLSRVGSYGLHEQPVKVVPSSRTYRCTVELRMPWPPHAGGSPLEQGAAGKFVAHIAGPYSREPEITPWPQPLVNYQTLPSGSLLPTLPKTGLLPPPAWPKLAAIGGNTSPALPGPSLPRARRSQRGGPNATCIEISATGGYPFIIGSPGIDIGLKVWLVRTSNAVDVLVEGTHDRFPAYEFSMNGKVCYAYNPVNHHQLHGPTPINLNSNYFNPNGYFINTLHLQSVKFIRKAHVLIPFNRR